MTKGSIEKRVSALERKSGYESKSVEIVYVNHDNFREKQTEIERLEIEGYKVIPIVGIGVNDETEHPEYFKYCQNNREIREHEKQLGK